MSLLAADASSVERTSVDLRRFCTHKGHYVDQDSAGIQLIPTIWMVHAVYEHDVATDSVALVGTRFGQRLEITFTLADALCTGVTAKACGALLRSSERPWINLTERFEVSASLEAMMSWLDVSEGNAVATIW